MRKRKELHANHIQVYADVDKKHGIIVGTSLKHDGIGENPVDLNRVRTFMHVVQSVREAGASPKHAMAKI